jgi:uncharacterized membrane protein (UPF0127 family)
MSIKKLYIELADTPIKRAKGLMYRKTMGDNHGMLFDFKNKEYCTFWMKNTYIPLDVAFLSDNGTVLQIESMSALNTKKYSSKIPCRYALEVNYGWFKKNNVKVGTKINGIKEIRNIKKQAQSIGSLPYLEEVDDDEFQNILDNENIQNEENGLNDLEENEITPEEMEQNVNPEVYILRSYRDIIKYAEDHNMELDILYWSKSGKVLPPRRLQPIPTDGYPIFSGPNGEYFKGFDVSPNISGGTWDIKGMQPKSYLLQNIINLELVEDEG